MASQSKIVPATLPSPSPPPPPTYCWSCNQNTNEWRGPALTQGGQNPGKWRYNCKKCHKATHPPQEIFEGLEEALAEASKERMERMEIMMTRMEVQLANKMERQDEAEREWKSAADALAIFESKHQNNGDLSSKDMEKLTKLQSTVADKHAKYQDKVRIANSYRNQLQDKRREIGWPADLDFPQVSQTIRAGGSGSVAASADANASMTPVGTQAQNSVQSFVSRAALPSSSEAERSQGEPDRLPYLDSDSSPDSSPTPGARRDLSSERGATSTSTSTTAVVSGLRPKSGLRMSFGPKPPRAMRGQSKVLAELDKLGNQGLEMTAEGKADKEGATAEAETSDKTIFSK
ncbi:uncharacterized protein PHACADRAFT_203271, partial [Phanerochaete carnosa HHB-10118-sp]